jgi:Cu(I)/Ag(I) efflux system membrane protein CusA/SilA
MMLGLVPIMWATGTGSDLMKHIAAPMVGGILTSFLMELMVYPAIYEIWKWNFEMKKQEIKQGRPISPCSLSSGNPSAPEH